MFLNCADVIKSPHPLQLQLKFHKSKRLWGSTSGENGKMQSNDRSQIVWGKHDNVYIKPKGTLGTKGGESKKNQSVWNKQ